MFLGQKSSGNVFEEVDPGESTGRTRPRASKQLRRCVCGIARYFITIVTVQRERRSRSTKSIGRNQAGATGPPESEAGVISDSEDTGRRDRRDAHSEKS